MQDQLQTRMQEQLAKIQQDVSDQMLESQKSMMDQLTRLLAGGLEKGKSSMINAGDDNEDLIYPPGFSPTNIQTQPDMYPRKSSVGLGSNPRDNSTNPVVPDLDEVIETEKKKVELPKELEEQCRWLEENFKEMENADYRGGIDAKELSLVSDLVLPPKFKTLEFEQYNGTSCPKAHITMFCRRIAGHVNNDQLLIHCFQESLVGAASKWYNQLSRTQINSWKDLAQAFMKQYGYVADIAPDRITLQNMEKMHNESFRQYAQ
ncbi:uncharacterized protein [Gossypium hirsutum]|uniref:Retrotransposon gag domain-containing protein n=1 Tax=Gossypium hirsutum TaxID=3635 RepID=A0A1U8LRK2_GOSHI|nr:uncharacterized protein LOC107930138 [Gossypium hirsutum]